MIRRIFTAVFLLPLIVLSIFYFPAVPFLLLVDIILVLSLFELMKLLAHGGVIRYWPTFPLILFLPWVWVFWPQLVLVYLLLAIFALLSWTVFRVPEIKAGISASGNLMALLYLGIPLSIAATYQRLRVPELMLILVIVWVSDSGAFFVGKKWGKHKIITRISPHKSLEGYIAGLFSGILAAKLYGLYVLSSWSSGYLLLTGAMLATAGMVGDLFESILKRGAHTKDSSDLIPGHGGLLDRLDALLFAFPTYHLLSVLVE